ncbi:MAG: hypothetical protein ABI934_13965, partial [Actinomycetota bacterium]
MPGPVDVGRASCGEVTGSPFRTASRHGMAALDELSPLIEPLLAATGAPTTARTPWLRAWARCHPAHHPWVVCVYDADDLVGAALLSVRRSLGLRHVVALGHHDSDHARFPVLNQHAAEALARAIVVGLRDLGPAWSLHLEQFPADDPVLHHLAALLSCAEIEPGAPLPVLAIPPDLPAEKYASKKFRQQTRAARRRFEEEGLTVELRYERQHERIEALLPEIREIRRSRDHDRGRKSGLDGSVGENWWRHVTLGGARARAVFCA